MTKLSITTTTTQTGRIQQHCSDREHIKSCDDGVRCLEAGRHAHRHQRGFEALLRLEASRGSEASLRAAPGVVEASLQTASGAPEASLHAAPSSILAASTNQAAQASLHAAPSEEASREKDDSNSEASGIVSSRRRRGGAGIASTSAGGAHGCFTVM